MKKILTLSLALITVTVLSARAEEAKALFDKHCAKCHGPDGKGDTKMGKKLGAKDYTDPKVQAALTDDAAFKAIKDGFKTEEGKKVMQAVEGLSDDDIKGLVAYLRTFKK